MTGYLSKRSQDPDGDKHGDGLFHFRVGRIDRRKRRRKP